MKILILSDSHSSLRLMRDAVQHIKPNAIVHLGDHYDDGEVLHEEFPFIPIHQVPGNCDRYRLYEPKAEVLSYPICGVKLYITHGHNHMVKSGLYRLLEDAKAEHVKGVLFGHTHCPHCSLNDGMWVLNPGSCGHGGGTVGVIETDHGEILSCKILNQEQWEEQL